MKNSVKTLALILVALFTLSSSTYASPSSDKAVEKAQSVVDDASPDDWKTLATQANVLLRKKKGLSEAKSWLEQSIDIHEAPYNLEIMGDYYAMNNLPDQAKQYYIRSINKMMEKDITANAKELQNKILALD